MPLKPFVHHNHNLLCSIDVETTGLDFSKNELIQISIIPLACDYTPSKDFKWFELLVKPERTNELDTENMPGWLKIAIRDSILHGMERWSATEHLRHWFYTELKLPPGKKIIPLGANYQFDRDFIREFMGGPLCYGEIFRDDFRDIQNLANCINDMAELHGEMVPFGRWSLSSLCNKMGVENLKIHSSTHDAVATAEVYKRLLNFQHWFHFANQKETAPVEQEQSEDKTLQI